MPTAKIGSNVYIENAIVPSDIEVPDGTIIRPTKGSEEVILVTQELIESVAKCI
jgi:glucose-1-phosphate adenylyltransferase